MMNVMGVEIAFPSVLLRQLKWYLYLRHMDEHAKKSTELRLTKSDPDSYRE
jgi:hypothetical protein